MIERHLQMASFAAISHDDKWTEGAEPDSRVKKKRCLVGTHHDQLVVPLGSGVLAQEADGALAPEGRAGDQARAARGPQGHQR